ncbi:putative transcriptional regulatory, AraC family protein [Comamonas phosphati]|nr:putative transcriptional regulatory, AraC family protein [Comamonas phosphati]
MGMPPSSSSLIRSASLSGYAALMRSLGHDPAALLRAAGLSARLLDNPETRIPIHTVRELLNAAARTTGAEDFALRLAARRSFSDLGPISLVLKDEPTPRQALDSLCRYLKLISTGMIMRIEDAGANVLIRQELMPITGLATRQSMELTVAMMFRILRELIGPQWKPLQVNFMHQAPADLSAHRAFFGLSPLFDQAWSGMVCSLADLQLLRTQGDPGVARFARDYLETALDHRIEGMGAACTELIIALLPGGRCTAQQVARHLGVDRRTLHRHLSAEGQSFSALLNRIRTELALRHLQESRQALGEVAGLLGFSTPSSFCHWFRASFGYSVSVWRRLQTGRGSSLAHGAP